MKFTDIHSHMAWGIDDGMPSKEDAIRALETARNDGIQTIVATPHIIPGKVEELEFMKINIRIEELTELAERAGIEIVKGCEFFMNDLAYEWLDRGIYNMIGDSDYMLAEFNPRMNIDQIPYADDILYELTVRGIVPVVAHAERYFDRVDTGRIKQWIDMGCCIQVNRTSITGMHGKRLQRNSMTILEEGLCHVVASDTHRSAGERISILSDAFDAVTEISGRENAVLLMKENPEHIIKNEKVNGMKVEIKKKNFFERLKGRK